MNRFICLPCDTLSHILDFGRSEASCSRTMNFAIPRTLPLCLLLPFVLSSRLLHLRLPSLLPHLELLSFLLPLKGFQVCLPIQLRLLLATLFFLALHLCLLQVPQELPLHKVLLLYQLLLLCAPPLLFLLSQPALPLPGALARFISLGTPYCLDFTHTPHGLLILPHLHLHLSFASLLFTQLLLKSLLGIQHQTCLLHLQLPRPFVPPVW